MKNPFSNLRERLYQRFVHKFYARDLLLELQLQARRETLDYINNNMRHCVICRNKQALFEYALGHAGRDGLVAEFGVARGDSIRLLARLTGATVHGFDSFLGLPEDWTGATETRGAFAARPRRLPGNVQLHEGLFSATLPAFLEDHDRPIRFMHVDCDLYESARTVFNLLRPRIVPGSVIVFDEYFNYPNWQEHEFKAFREYIKEEGRRYEYLAFCARGGSVTLRITA